MIVDSWLVEDGAVYGLERHLRRFAAAVAERFGVEVPGEVLARASATPAGAWFPRISYDGSRFDVVFRPAPPRRSATRLWLPEAEDPRRFPWLKGPDMPLQLALRKEARRRGADEAVLHRDGVVREATTSTLFFIEESGGRSILIRPLADRLPGVTEERYLRTWPGEVRTRRVEVAELPRLRAVSLSSLHGVTPARLAGG